MLGIIGYCTSTVYGSEIDLDMVAVSDHMEVERPRFIY